MSEATRENIHLTCVDVIDHLAELTLFFYLDFVLNWQHCLINRQLINQMFLY